MAHKFWALIGLSVLVFAISQFNQQTALGDFDDDDFGAYSHFHHPGYGGYYPYPRNYSTYYSYPGYYSTYYSYPRYYAYPRYHSRDYWSGYSPRYYPGYYSSGYRGFYWGFYSY